LSWTISRRALLRGGAAALTMGGAVAVRLGSHFVATAASKGTRSAADLRDRIEGMLVGSLIGDAAGGPIEFIPAERVRKFAPTVHQWKDEERLDGERCAKLSAAFRLLSYEDLRPKPAPYGPWAAKGPPGTLTDDTRHKIILMAALAEAAEKHRQLEPADLARAYLAFEQRAIFRHDIQLRGLCHDWLKEQNAACRWLLGERGTPRALPPERLWGGMPTVMGQMTLLPLAALSPGQPKKSYVAAYRMSFSDNGAAKDLNAAIVAGLSEALLMPPDAANNGHRWDAVRRAMLDTDPYDYAHVPWVPRPTQRWLDFAVSAASDCDHRPARLFHQLETKLGARTWWEAHVTFASVMSILTLCPDHPLAAMQLALDMGHDTDSTCQLLGAFLGAAYGTAAFPAEMRQTVTERLQADYAESLEAWVDLLTSEQDRSGKGLTAAATRDPRPAAQTDADGQK